MRAVVVAVVAVSSLVTVALTKRRDRGRKSREPSDGTSTRRGKKDDKVASEELGAFVRSSEDVQIPGASDGRLKKLKFCIKDIFDVRGRRVGFGCPAWRANEARRHATCVDAVLNAGASAVGMTVMDELAYSINGENEHYGTPINPRAKDLIPGGSSSGSAVACAAAPRVGPRPRKLAWPTVSTCTYLRSAAQYLPRGTSRNTVAS